MLLLLLLPHPTPATTTMVSGKETTQRNNPELVRNHGTGCLLLNLVSTPPGDLSEFTPAINSRLAKVFTTDSAGPSVKSGIVIFGTP